MRPRTGILVSAIAILCLSACGDDAADSPDPTTATTGTDTNGSGGDPADPPDPAAGELTLVDVGLDLDEPIDLVAVADSDDVMFVAERGGRIVQVAPDGEGLAEVGTVIDLSDDVGVTDAERGLLGLAVDEGGDHLYASYTRSSDGSSQLDEFELTDGADGWRASVDSRRSLLSVDQPFGNHNGGHVAVGPDGALYLGLGDGGASGDPDGRAQDPDTLLGKLVRIDPTDDAGPETWALGLRNPWRFSFDPATDDLWIADVGQDRFEEINRLPGDEDWGRGANLGWDLYEGFEPFEDPSPHPETSDDPLTEPVFVYEHDEGCSVTGGVVYRGTDLPQLEGHYLFGDFCDPELRALRTADDGSVEQLRLGVEHPTLVGFARRADGEVFLISLDAGIVRLASV